jgi:hypothetical protein
MHLDYWISMSSIRGALHVQLYLYCRLYTNNKKSREQIAAFFSFFSYFPTRLLSSLRTS